MKLIEKFMTELKITAWIIQGFCNPSLFTYNHAFTANSGGRIYDEYQSLASVVTV